MEGKPNGSTKSIQEIVTKNRDFAKYLKETRNNNKIKKQLSSKLLGRWGQELMGTLYIHIL